MERYRIVNIGADLTFGKKRPETVTVAFHSYHELIVYVSGVLVFARYALTLVRRPNRKFASVPNARL